LESKNYLKILLNKHKNKSLVSPEKLISYAIKEKIQLPRRAILCLAGGLANSLVKRSDFLTSFYILGLKIDIYKDKTRGESVSVVGYIGIGAPAAVVCVEKLQALGVREFFSLGVVGSLSGNLSIGEKVLLKSSFRGESCSYHYKDPCVYMETPRNKTYNKLVKNLSLKPVKSWSTDAPFRETKEEINYFISQGVECVEMESSALMAVGEYYNLSVFCLAVVSDHLSIESWDPNFHHPSVRDNLKTLLNQALFL